MPVSTLQSQSPEMTASLPQPKLFQDGSAPVFRACSSAMQRSTLTNVRIRSTRDAHIIFHAVSLNILPIITRRLDADERAALRSGCVYAWEERGPHTEVTGLGIERFTEGRRWGPSRVRDVRSLTLLLLSSRPFSLHLSFIVCVLTRNLFRTFFPFCFAHAGVPVLLRKVPARPYPRQGEPHVGRHAAQTVGSPC